MVSACAVVVMVYARCWCWWVESCRWCCCCRHVGAVSVFVIAMRHVFILQTYHIKAIHLTANKDKLTHRVLHIKSTDVDVHAHLAVRIFPSTPLVPKPPGSTTPSTPSRVSHAAVCFSGDSSLDSSYREAFCETLSLRDTEYISISTQRRKTKQVTHDM